MAAVTGKLEADFTSFYDACAKAVTSLLGINTTGENVQTTLGGMEGQRSQTALGMVGAQTATAAFQKGLEFLTSSFDAFVDAESNVRHLTAALELQGNATQDVIEQYKQLGETYQQTTAYSAEAITEAERMFTLIGQVGPENMAAALQAATNLASGLGINLTQAVMMVSKAAEGNITSLKRYGIEVDGARAKAEGLPYVLDAINERMGGQAQADMDTTAGKIAQLSNNWETFKISVGEAIVNGTGIVQTMQAIAGTSSDTIPPVAGVTKAIKDQGDAAKQTTGYLATWLNALSHIPGVQFDPVKFFSDIKTGINQVDSALAQTPPELFGGKNPFAEIDAAAKAAGSSVTNFASQLADAQWQYKNFAADPSKLAELNAAFKLGTVNTAELTAQFGLNAAALGIAKKAYDEQVASVKKANDEAAKFAAAQKAITDAMIPLTAAQQATAVSNQAFGISAEMTAKELGISTTAVSAYLNSLKEAQKQADALAKVQQDMADKTHALTLKWTEDWDKALQKQADTTAKIVAADIKAWADYSDKNAQLAMSQTEIQIDNLNKQRDAAILNLGQRTDANALWYDNAKTQIDDYYQHETDVANKTSDTIEERMAKQGVYTQERLDEMAFDAAEAYNQMVADGNFTAAELEAAAKKSSDAWNLAAGIVETSWQQTMKTIATGMGEIGSSLSSLGTAVGGTFGKIASAGGKAFTDIKGGLDDVMKGLASGNLIGEISGITAGLIKMGAAAVNGVKSLLGLGTAGRDAVVQFANSMGGFDELHTKLDAIGASGEQLWIKLTQGVGRNDPAAAQAAIQAVTDALNAQSSAQSSTTVTTEAQAAATIQTATEASNALDTVTQKLKDNATDWQTWGDAVNGIIDQVGNAILHMPTPSAPSTTAVPGFAGGTGGQFLNFGTGTLAMLHGNERVMTEGESAGGGGGTAVIQIDGKTMAEVVVPNMPGVIQRYGLTP